MTEVFVSFRAESLDGLRRLVEAFLGGPSTHAERVAAGLVEASSDPALEEDAATLTDEEYDTKHRPNGGEERAPPQPPARRARTPRAPRVPAPPVAAATPAPAPSPPPSPPPVDLPPLDTLKSMITAAVRLAQKGEGSTRILDLLPGFKDATGLVFVMNAEDRHRGALYDLIQAAGLPEV